MRTTTAASALLALLALSILVAVAPTGAAAQGCTVPPLCLAGDIASADLGRDPTTGELTVAAEINQVLHSRRFGPDGSRIGAWRAEIYHRSSSVSVNGRTREVYEATVARNAVNITRRRDDGFKLESWDTGFTGYAGDLEAEAWSSELLMARYTGSELRLVALSRDGAMLATWQSGYDEPAPVVDLTTDRVYYLGVGPAEEGGSGGRVARYDDLGRRTAEWPVEERPAALAAGPDGNVYVATRTWEPHQGSLIVLSDLGTARDTWPLGARPVDVEVALDGTAHVLVLCCSGRGLGVVTIAPDGRRSGGWMAWMELYLPTTRLR